MRCKLNEPKSTEPVENLEISKNSSHTRSGKAKAIQAKKKKAPYRFCRRHIRPRT